MAEVTNPATTQPNPTMMEKSFVASNGTPTPKDSRPQSAHSAPSFKSASSQHTPASSLPAAATEVEEEWKMPTTGPLKTPIPRPAADTNPTPPSTLTPEQETKYTAVLTQVSQWTTIPSSTAKNAPQVPLEDHERMFLTRECLLRYLRATKWKTADALKRLQGTLSWRREYGADTFTHDYISIENETGKQVQLGYDQQQRPCLYLRPGKQNTKISDRQIHHLCYMLDRLIDMMPPGVESNCLIIDFKTSSNSNIPSVAQARAVLNILQTHNPERLGRALICDTPWYVNTFFKLISPFIDPVTREKMKFNQTMTGFVPKSQLWDQFKGDVNFEYDHSVYWPALGAECAKRREAYRRRWEEGGKKIGESEVYLRGGNHPSLQQTLDSTAQSNGAAADQGADSVAAGVEKLTV
jgi:hypothetical protein